MPITQVSTDADICVSNPRMMQLVEIGGSLVAILALSWFALKMRLGGDPRIRTEAEARHHADQAVSGFEPVDIALDRAGYGALMRDAEGRILMLRRHGAHFAGRLITHRPEARLDQNLLIIEPEDRPFGTVILDLGKNAQIWAASLRRLEHA